MITLAIVSLIISVACIIYSAHLSIIFNTFNKNIKNWSLELDNSTRDAINMSARDILRELDEKVNNLKIEENDNTEND